MPDITGLGITGEGENTTSEMRQANELYTIHRMNTKDRIEYLLSHSDGRQQILQRHGKSTSAICSQHRLNSGKHSIHLPRLHVLVEDLVHVDNLFGRAQSVVASELRPTNLEDRGLRVSDSDSTKEVTVEALVVCEVKLRQVSMMVTD